MSESQKILIVDDREANLYALEKVLCDMGAEIVKATSGNQALKALLNHQFALAILDVRMPGMDGYELAELLRGDPKTQHLPIIFLTATYVTEENFFRGYETGAVDYIVKPYHPEVLCSKIKIFLKLDQQKRELEGYSKAVFQELKLRNLILSTQQETTIDGILVVGEKGDTMSSNHQFAKMWNIPSEVMATKSDDRMLQSVLSNLTEPEEFIRRVKKFYENRDETSHDEFALKDGRIFDRYSAPMFSPEGRYFGRVWYFRDITQKKKDENRIESLLAKATQDNRQLRELNQIKDNFLSTVSHELRTPLTSVLGYLKVLRTEGKERLGESCRLFLETALKNAERLKNLIDDLLDLPTMEQGSLKIVRKTILLAQVIRDSLEVTQNLADSKKIRLDYGSINPGLTVEVDVDKLGRVFINLISNAVKFTPEGGNVTISARPERSDERDGLLAWVKNSGEDIPLDELEKIFSRFYQIDNTATRKVGGTGLGLAICKHIIEAHGGKIWAESKKGDGVTIFFFIPRA